MSVAEKLDQLRDRNPGCSLAVFGDLSARLTLCASASDKRPQEQLDTLMNRTAGMLDSPVARRVAAALGGVPDTALSEAVAFGVTENQLTLRSRRDTSDVLSCVCAPDVDLPGVAVEAARVLHQLGDE